ncbi:ubl carboxyl-terminal hydrolase 18 [Centropristis striata]|uniref:ubl carboxyl-terminal hydrolase 18 n=1 Tax=Centropristis striata TaxID=184440 RepID=UPI0027DF54A2|nr:ubl carboxyl-terminal hydrolase 18 [Centropristis striata]
MTERICIFFSRLNLRDCSVTGMRGLSNFRLSCCVNTLLQTFSATWEMGELLDKWNPAAGRGDRNVPLQLKKVLAAMKSDHSQPAPHQDFLKSLDKNDVTLGLQHDADEVFLSILDFIQRQMDDKTLALEIQNLFKISVETYLECSDCSNVQTLTSYLLSLPLHVKEDHDSLEGCLTSFFAHQELKGVNSCFCTQCEKKTSSKQGVKLLALPRILCVHLKRFRNQGGSTRKLGCPVTFPETFDLSETHKEAFSSQFAQNDCRYTLHAVVVHCGHAMCGHYTAYVRHRGNQRWYYADDSHVEQASWEEVKGTYGGRERATAYMLMYRRGSKEEVQQPELSG